MDWKDEEGHRYRRRYARHTRCSACIHDKPPRTDRFRSEVTITRAARLIFRVFFAFRPPVFHRCEGEAKSRVPFPILLKSDFFREILKNFEIFELVRFILVSEYMLNAKWNQYRKYGELYLWERRKYELGFPSVIIKISDPVFCKEEKRKGITKGNYYRINFVKKELSQRCNIKKVDTQKC